MLVVARRLGVLMPSLMLLLMLLLLWQVFELVVGARDAIEV